jgi:hypothetical protein
MQSTAHWLLGGLLAAGLPAEAQPVAPSPAKPPRAPVGGMVPPAKIRAPVGDITPSDFGDARADLVVLKDVTQPNRIILQGGGGFSFFDEHRGVFLGRLTGWLSAGRRFGRWGVLARAEWDSTMDFTTDIDHLGLVNIGAGIEFLNFLGHVRNSLVVGASILATDTVIDDAGEVGWFIDLRPGALRWNLGPKDWVFEFTPIGVDIMVPVTSGIPLIVYTYTTSLGVEWAL